MVYDSQPAIAAPARAAAADVTVGVLALQGAFREHARVVDALGARSALVRTPAELAVCDALVIPGGESTAIRKLLVSSGLYEPLRERLADGMPALGTCAGMIVLASTEDDGAPPAYGLLDVEVARNGFGRQPSSFEAPVALELPDAGTQEVAGVFIRAPRITATGAGVDVIGRLRAGRSAGEAVAVRQGNLLACTFHPELVGEGLLHAELASLAAGRMGA